MHKRISKSKDNIKVIQSIDLVFKFYIQDLDRDPIRAYRKKGKCPTLIEDGTKIPDFMSTR